MLCVAYEMTLAQGLNYERRVFHGLFATNDQKEGKDVIHFRNRRPADQNLQAWARSLRRGRLTSPTIKALVGTINATQRSLTKIHVVPVNDPSCVHKHASAPNKEDAASPLACSQWRLPFSPLWSCRNRCFSCYIELTYCHACAGNVHSRDEHPTDDDRPCGGKYKSTAKLQ